MNSREDFCDSIYADEIRIAGRELFAFIRVVTQLCGSEQAKLAADDWLEESELMSSPLRSTNWRAVTMAALVRMAHRAAVLHDCHSDVQGFDDSARLDLRLDGRNHTALAQSGSQLCVGFETVK